MSSDSHSETTEPAKFGLVDLVDAFTAFRHEYRTQVKESRQLYDSLQSLTAKLEEIAKPQALQAASQSESDSSAPHRWIIMLIDFDIQWTRAIEAASRYEESAQQSNQQLAEAIKQEIATLTPWQRWWCSTFVSKLQVHVNTPSRNHTGISEGLNILLSRLRNILAELRVERIETIGLPFDGTLMRSIGTVVDPEFPAGTVAQQLSPAYRSEGNVIKFADVRVSATK